MLAVTHNGPFHADDVLAAAMLREVDQKVAIIRTRDQQTINRPFVEDGTRVVVFDVGGRFDHTGDPEYYDHHMRGGAQVPEEHMFPLRKETGIPFSSAGLVGTYVFAPEFGNGMWEYVEERLVLGVDAQDNGVEICSGAVRSMDFSSIVSSFNPAWDDESPDFDAAFERAIGWASTILRGLMVQFQRKEKAAALVEDALRHRTQPEIVVLEKFCPWQKTLADYPEVLYVVFPDSASSTWRVQCVPVEPGGFESRRSLPEAWHGLNGTDLDAVMGVDGGVFCHRNGFIAGHETHKGALAMALAALR